MSEIITIGPDLAKNVFQVHGADGAGRAVPQQGVGYVRASYHNMQVAQRRARQKRNIFKGFSTRGGDPGRHPG